jgi:hypothetical protein
MLTQLDSERRTVSYDAYDIIVRQLVDMMRTKAIDIAPDYQRQFIWKEDRESELVESSQDKSRASPRCSLCVVLSKGAGQGSPR